MFKEIITVYFENHVKPINALTTLVSVQSADLFIVEIGGFK
jgi:hypothetical protein